MVRFFSVLFSLTLSVNAWCCTSVIISGKIRADGRPVMLKHRDTDELMNAVRWFQGPVYSFIGLVNASSEGGEVWTGTNRVGFSIMNTATYDLKDDGIPASRMDREGVVMYRALGICATLHDFENLLDTLPRPLGVEANFGVIDARGGAAWYEVNNHSWTKFDVNEVPSGYRVVTNFTETGRREDRRGVDRYEAASRLFAQMDLSTAGHKEIFNGISRSGKPIERETTSASIVIEGVKAGEDPLNTVMWTLCGYPSAAIYLPFVEKYVRNGSEWIKKSLAESVCARALDVKKKNVSGCPKSFLRMEKKVDETFQLDLSEGFYLKMMEKAAGKYFRRTAKYFGQSD